MKGLYIKDFKLLKNQKTFFIIIGVMAIFFAITQSNIYFVVSYATFISSLFVISSISYDEFNNGNTFLFTLPISRSGYVKEKYFFAVTLALATCFLATLFSNAIVFLKGTELVLGESLLTSFMILLIALTLVMIIIPVQLKFGQNKGNIAMVLVVGVVFVAVYLLSKLVFYLNVDLSNVISFINQIGLAGLVAIAALLVVIIGIGSYKVSYKIMINKEF